jgi:FdhD protein
VAAGKAPTDLAVSAAERLGLTLIGFVRGDGFNVYAGEERITLG